MVFDPHKLDYSLLSQMGCPACGGELRDSVHFPGQYYVCDSCTFKITKERFDEIVADRGGLHE